MLSLEQLSDFLIKNDKKHYIPNGNIHLRDKWDANIYLIRFLRRLGVI